MSIVSHKVEHVLDVGLIMHEPVSIATLGPHSTSSAAIAHSFCSWASRNLDCAMLPVLLCDSYEHAADIVRAGEATHVLVANAYAYVNRFYMDPAFEIAAAFPMLTPDYGLAAVRGADLTASVRVASHRAPIPLIDELRPAGMTVCSVVERPSTSAAAEMVATGAVEVALTTVDAAQYYDLEFVSATRPIEMLWTLFAHASRPS